MKGILKIYHPEETLKYKIKSTYCKAVYSNNENFLEVEIITDDDLDHVEDDSLQYNFPQISLSISDFPISSQNLDGKTFEIEDDEENSYGEVNLFDDEEAFIYDNKLNFTTDNDGELELIWSGKIDDFYTQSEELIDFKLKCNFRQEELDIED
ncbi:hypothetical protein [Elizabethkingia sp. JS20170427COW]|uniref:hypothetical protein n=1 Tax=Elizabethkingia sp. JS20170427COW TaxID=2583851 RepID=UPI0011104C04|nr:hypothetical protein [Elizabethkingia sp. JS20170427COW]QCX52998.1 hypothetical protein FGE20_04235 [Elizabethkingia sp. JS20170427COW]